MEDVKPLRTLVDDWRKLHSNPDHAWHEQECCANEMAAELQTLLDAWDAKLTEVAEQQSGSIGIGSIKMRVLGARKP